LKSYRKVKENHRENGVSQRFTKKSRGNIKFIS
jgi:hypothetical protein